MEINSLDAFGDILQTLKFERVIYLLLGLLILIFIVKKLSKWSEELHHKFPSKRLLILQVHTVFAFVLYIFGSLTIFYLSINPTKEMLVAVGGSIAVAVGLALKDIIGSFIAGIILLFDRPFQVGDRVQFGEIYGEVVQLGLRAVRLNTLDDNLVTIPNNKFLTDAVSSGNAGALDMMIVNNFHTALDENIEKVSKIIHEVVISSRYVYLEKPVKIVLQEVEVAYTLALCFTVKCYVLDVKYEKSLQTDIVKRVTEAFTQNKIRRPLPSSVRSIAE